MKEKIYTLLIASGHPVVDYGDLVYDGKDDYPDFAIPLARAVAAESWNEVPCCAAAAFITANRLTECVRQSVTMIFRRGGGRMTT